MWLPIIITLVVGYLLGNINGSILVSKLIVHDDVRKHGSGNAGLTNFFRSYGGWNTLLVAAIDIGKAVAACFIGGFLLKGYMKEGQMLGAVAVSLGHDFPALLKFKGGKGIMSGFAVALVIDWRVGLLIFAVFALFYGITKYVSLGSVLSSGSFGFIYAYFHWGKTFPIIVGFFLSGLIVWMHRGNIKRLIKGEERKTDLFGKGKQK